MKLFKNLLSFLPVLSALRAAEGQGVFQWSLGGSNAPSYIMSADGSPMSVGGATLSLRSTTSTPTTIHNWIAQLPGSSHNPAIESTS